jgi:mRNA interferase MazF
LGPTGWSRDLVSRAPYVPERGDLVWLTFDLQAGREQAGRCPALVLSPALYNRRASLALVCPITSRVKRYPFEVSLPDGFAISGAVLADHLKSADWAARRAQFVARAPSEVVAEVTAKLRPLLGL